MWQSRQPQRLRGRGGRRRLASPDSLDLPSDRSHEVGVGRPDEVSHVFSSWKTEQCELTSRLSNQYAFIFQSTAV